MTSFVAADFMPACSKGLQIEALQQGTGLGLRLSCPQAGLAADIAEEGPPLQVLQLREVGDASCQMEGWVDCVSTWMHQIWR
eukprot:4022848-Amphidinium_carterae.1